MTAAAAPGQIRVDTAAAMGRIKLLNFDIDTVLNTGSY